MPVTMRPFDECVATLRASRPDPLREQTSQSYLVETAWSFDDLADWPAAPPLTSLFRTQDPRGHGAEIFTDPKQFADLCSLLGPPVGVWNAKGVGRETHGDGWMLLDVACDNGQASEDDDGYEGPVHVLLGLWTVEDGWALGVFRPDETELFARVMGFESWPTEGWEPCEVWIGE